MQWVQEWNEIGKGEEEEANRLQSIDSTVRRKWWSSELRDIATKMEKEDKKGKAFSVSFADGGTN